MKPSTHPKSAQPTLGDLLDLARQMAADGETSGAGLRHRDRRVGQDLANLEGRPLAQLLGWLQRIRADGDDLRGERVNVLHRLGLLLLGVAGLFFGWGAAAVVFRYDGTHPVNVIHVLAVFVCLQLVMLVLFGIGLLPPAVTRFLPGMRAVQDALRYFSPGRLQNWLVRYLPQQYRETIATHLGRGQAHQRLYGRVDRWVVAHSSQTFAVLFNVGALASCLYLVVFSDLAFAWSTTLQLEPTQLQRWTDLLAAPWATFFDNGRPSLELIESTRYFRFKEGTFPAVASPAGLGGWWPFLVMCMAVYGLLPRLATLWIARRRLRAAVNETFLHFPGASDLLARLNSELVETRAEQPEIAGTETAVRSDSTATTDLAGLPAQVINWSAAVDPTIARPWLSETAAVTVAAWHEAGGSHSLAHDKKVVDAVGQSGERNTVILVNAWEPPLAEFLDFLSELRSVSEPDQALLVAPLGRTPDGETAVADQTHLAMWQATLARAGDPWLRLLRLGGGAA